MRRVAAIVFLALVVTPGFAAHEEEEAGVAFQAALRLSTARERWDALIAVADAFPDTKSGWSPEEMSSPSRRRARGFCSRR